MPLAGETQPGAAPAAAPEVISTVSFYLDCADESAVGRGRVRAGGGRQDAALVAAPSALAPGALAGVVPAREALVARPRRVLAP